MIKKIFEPTGIAIIGASNDTKKWGGNILFNLLTCGYKGKIYPINNKERNVQGLKCYSSVLDIPNEVDLAVIVVPAKVFNNVLDECGKKGIKGIVGVTAGFKEIGNAELENQSVEILHKYGMRMIGPNTLGIMNLHKNINVSIVQQTPKFGSISFIAQSGTMGIAIVEDAVRKGIGLNKIISIGNKADIDDIDILEYLDKDETTQSIVIYAEGINRGKKFIEVAKKIKKPIIILKAGRSSKGAKAAFSHTGSMSGSDEVYSIAFKQSGVIRVDKMEEIFDAAIAFQQPLPETRRVGIITNGGGAGIVAADECEKFGLELPDIEETTKDEIKKHLIEFATVSNPVDTAALASYEMYYTAINGMLNDPNIDALIVIYVHTQVADAIPPANAMSIAIKTHRYINKGNKPIIACFFGGPGYEEGVKILEENKIPSYETPERAVRALNYLIQYKKFLERKG